MKKYLFFLLLAFSSWASFAQTIRYVKEGGAGLKDGSSWNNASDDLQLMINQATANSEIWVAKGTYRPTRPANNLGTINPTNRNNAFVLKDNVKIYGAFSGTETSVSQRNLNSGNLSSLNGDIGATNNDADNAYHVVISAGVSNQALLDGFIISGGNANAALNTNITVNGMNVEQSNAGGMYNINSSVIINNCEFILNGATYGGGMFNRNAPVTVSNSKFMSNSATGNCGALFNLSSNTIISNCVFMGNTSNNWGGAMLNDNSAPVISGCTFTENVTVSKGGGDL